MFSVRLMCRALMVHVSGFYAWLKEPLSLPAREDLRQTNLIRQAWTDCGKVYGYRKLHDDRRDQGETCSESRVARLAGLAGIAARIGNKRRPGRYGGKPAVTGENSAGPAARSCCARYSSGDRYRPHQDARELVLSGSRHRPVFTACGGPVVAVADF